MVERKIPYYSPQMDLKQVVKALMTRGAEGRCVAYYQQYTGKKYVLLTNSCRTALYLTYRVLCKDASVLVSPLICKAALLPIVESGNKVLFADVDEKTWNMDAKRLPNELSKDVKAMQLTYLGGVPNGIAECVGYAREHGLTIIEDAAQGFGGKSVGMIGDVVCLSMIKTAYGISGGVLATNDENIYRNAKEILTEYSKTSLAKCAYRIVRNIIDTRRTTSRIAQRLYDWMLGKRPSGIRKADTLQLGKINRLEAKVAVSQQSRLAGLHEGRKRSAQQIVERLDAGRCMSNYTGVGVPMKLYVKTDVSARQYVEELRSKGIEAMHLQQKYDSCYQDSMADIIWREAAAVNELSVFRQLHDSIISVPLWEGMPEEAIEKITQEFKKSIR